MRGILDFFRNRSVWIVVVISLFTIYASRLEGSETLLGWDNLSADLDPQLVITRSINASWSEFQGVGISGGIAYGADLTRQIILSGLSFVVPQNLLRWVWAMAMLFIGPLGVYSLSCWLARGKSKEDSEISGVVAATFYLLNMGTLQNFYLPFESFVGYYGFLPWLVYLILRYLQSGKRKYLLWTFIAGVVGGSAFVVQTMFIVFLVIIGLLVAAYLLRGGYVSRALKVGGALIGAQLHWLMPVVYSTINSSKDVASSKGNVLATPENLLMNRSSGDLIDIAALRGFWVEYLGLNRNMENVYVMESWRDWMNSGWVIGVAVIMFGLAVGGYFVSIYRKSDEPKSWMWLGMGVVMIISILMLSAGKGLVGVPYMFAVEGSDLFGQLFRATYTKFSIVLMFALSVGLGGLVGSALRSNVRGMLVGVVMVLCGLFGYQFLTRGVLSDDVKVEMPREYNELFEYLGGIDRSSRVALFPVNNLWGWQVHDWGYRGSGFVWYGIEQPVLSRAFDFWSPYNEGFYHEVSRAIYTEDEELLAMVLDKYDVSFVIVDESVIDPGRDKSVLRYEETRKMLEDIRAEEAWEESFLSVWSIPCKDNPCMGEYVGAPERYYLAGGDSKYAREDPIYVKYGEYLEVGSAYYPFSDLMKEQVDVVSYSTDVFGRARVNITRELSSEYDTLTLPSQEVGARISLPYVIKYVGGVVTVEFETIVRSSEFEYPELPNITLDVPGDYGNLLVELGGDYQVLALGREVRGIANLVIGEDIEIKINDYSESREFEIEEQFESGEVVECWTREGGDPLVESLRESELLKVKTRDAAGCLSIRLGELGEGVVDISLPHRSGSGARPNFCFNRQGGEYQCLHDDVFYSTGSSSDWAKVERRVDVEGGTYWLDVTARPSDVPGEEWEIEYMAPDVRFYPQIETYTASSDFWSSLLESREVAIDSREISLSILTRALPVDFALNGKSRADNCDVLMRGRGEKIIAGDMVTFIADERGGACDTLILSDIDQSGEYIMRWVGENMEGRSVKFYLYSPDTMRSEIEYLLPEGKFDHSVSVLSQNASDNPYSLTVETRSFGEYTENRIENVEMYPVPLAWLAGISVGEGEYRENGIRIEKVKKVGTFMYIVDAVNDGESLVTLSQGYDDGWIAWVRGGEHEFLKHYRVSGWKNGWVVGGCGLPVNSCQEGERHDQGDIRLIMFFWPQMLQYAGFGVMLAVLVIVIFRSRSVKQNR